MMQFISNNKLIVLLMTAILLMLAYHFLFMNKEKAAWIVYRNISGVDWEAGYLKARARAFNGKKESFKYKGSEYNTSTGKKII